MTFSPAISTVLLVLLVSLCVGPEWSIAAQKKVAGNGAVGYVIQMGAFRDLKNAEQMLSDLRSMEVELFLARKDNGLYVVQSRRFSSRDKAHALAVSLVAGKQISSYFITSTPGKTVSGVSGHGDATGPYPMETVQKHENLVMVPPGQTAEKSPAKAANIPVDQNSSAISVVPVVPVDGATGARADVASPERDGSGPGSRSGKSMPSLDQELFMQEYLLVKDSDNIEKHAIFVAAYDSNLKQCKMPDTFREIAAFFARKAQPDRATSIYRTLLSCLQDRKSRLGILSSLQALLPSLEFLAMFEQEKTAAAGSPEHLKKLDSFKANLLFTLLETEPDRLELFADAVLAFYPGDRVALTVLAWYQFRHDRYEEAYKYFSELHRLEPEQIDHVTGMIYALSGMKEPEKVMELAPVVNSFFYTRLPGSRE